MLKMRFTPHPFTNIDELWEPHHSYIWCHQEPTRCGICLLRTGPYTCCTHFTLCNIYLLYSFYLLHLVLLHDRYLTSPYTVLRGGYIRVSYVLLYVYYLYCCRWAFMEQTVCCNSLLSRRGRRHQTSSELWQLPRNKLEFVHFLFDARFP
jgi:hypothetical protein